MERVSIFEHFHNGFDKYLLELLETDEFVKEFSLSSEERCERASNTIQSYLNDSEEHIKDIYKNVTHEDDHERENFFTTYSKIWGKCIQLSILHLRILDDLCSNIQVTADEENIKEFVLARILGKGIRTYAEIITLISNGFPYGASSLTRNLLELMIISRFISMNEKEVALEYFKASDQPLDQQNDDYGWAKASNLFKENDRITLRKIRDHCGMKDHLYTRMYSFHCKFAHASPQTVNYNLSEVSDDIFTGPTFYSVEVPGINASMFIRDIVLNFFYLNSNDEISMKVLFCAEWSTFLSNKYNDAAKLLTRDFEKNHGNSALSD
jgi:hypothetical protein